MFPLRDVMDLSNRHYYANNPVIGSKGDFITAPEISQIFGEIVALWVLLSCEKIQCNHPTIVELGPGRGTLMQDMIRTFQKSAPLLFNDFQPKIVLVDSSPSLQKQQKETLKDCSYSLYFSSTIPFDEGALQNPTFFIANEFFDALPVQQYIYHNKQWHEVFLGFGEEISTISEIIGKKAKRLLRPTTLPFDWGFERTVEEGAVLEYSKDSIAIAHSISQHLKAYGGGGLIIDYGDNTPFPRFGDTLQSVKNHAYVNPFDHIGTADWTYHVDFSRLCTLFQKNNLSCTFENQQSFLKRHGFDARLEILLKNCATRQEHDDAFLRAHRLVNSKDMGELFKVLSVIKSP